MCLAPHHRGHRVGYNWCTHYSQAGGAGRGSLGVKVQSLEGRWGRLVRWALISKLCSVLGPGE